MEVELENKCIWRFKNY